MNKLLLPALALLATAHAASATVIVPTSAGVQGGAGAAGLSGTYYKATGGSTNFSIASTLSAMKSTPASGTFVATSLSYAGSDTSTITSFLGNDGASYTGRAAAANDLSDGIIDLSGYLYVASAGTYTFALNHDDSAQLSIGNQVILSRDCCGTDTASVMFQSAGYYAIDAVYSNTLYGNYSGGANFSLTENGTTLTSSSLVRNIPEPATLALLGIGLAGVLAARRRHTAAAA